MTTLTSGFEFKCGSWTYSNFILGLDYNGQAAFIDFSTYYGSLESSFGVRVGTTGNSIADCYTISGRFMMSLTEHISAGVKYAAFEYYDTFL